MSLMWIHCHHCNAEIAIASVFARHRGRTHEASAILSFEKGASGKRHIRKVEPGSAGGCRILLGDEEFPNPTAAAKRIVEHEVNGWTFWKYKTPRGVMTLDQLAAEL